MNGGVRVEVYAREGRKVGENVLRGSWKEGLKERKGETGEKVEVG